ncbi:putative phosphoenolpyruvate synthase [Trichonephila inaurata madagascariensis]|uniref:Putative phosphoenolpyruvate synthase n=1 Tax=Trichonephila inaurata madagascariensis TaxID=2747483 RepID=A0A8X6MIN3_9ARAC|nr:putative phosphoenolpyruvate synthase [Trichonephila inaurata madagascariensis]
MTVVSGSVEPDTFKLRRRGHEEVELDSVVVGAKHQKIIMQDSGGTITEDLDENSRKESCLSKETAERLGKLSLKIESFYKSSRDIEWGISKDQIYILQSRPVTNIAPETDYEMKHEFDIPLRCETEYFSVANLGEVMPGASSPLGIDCLTKYFSSFFKVHAVTKGMKKSSDLLVEKYHWIFPAPFMNHMMLKVIEMIGPNGIDSQVSKGFMISMFGRILKDPEMLSYGRERFKKLVKPPLKTKLRFYWDLFTYDFKLERVKKEIDAYHLDFLTKKTAKETFTAIVRTCSDFDISAMAHVDCLTGSSMWNMIMFSILSNAKGDLDNDVYGDFAKLLATSSNVESANIPHAMQEVADQIAKDINCEEFKSMSPEQAEKWLQASTSLAGYKFRQFLKRHGHRCLGEFDVHSITWGMDPKMLVKLLQNLVGVNKENKKKEEESISETISGLQVPLGFISKCLLKFVLLQCRRGVRGREAGKSIMIKSIHHWRKGYRHLGKLMASEGYLPDEELLFFLTINEINDLLNTRSPNIISRANYRRKIFPILEKYKFPEIMKGNPKPINDEDESIDSASLDSDLILTGFPVSQGVIKGYARVAMTLEEAEHLKPGEILITYSTDIGWSPYFPIISGVVTELGGLISHGAVVSREYGLPCVVGLQGATKKFHTGDYVLLDGKKGILQRLPQPEK